MTSQPERQGAAVVVVHLDAEVAQREGVRMLGSATQGEWLTALGIDARAAALAKVSPGRAEEIAQGVLYLVSDEASYTTGTILNIDGGYLAQ